MNFLQTLRKKPLIIMSCDPGIVNFAFTITKHDKTGITILTSAMVKYPIKSLGLSFNEDRKNFTAFFEKILNQYKPNIVSVELFMARSFRTNQAAPITAMLTIIAMLADERKIPFAALMASSWKRSLEKIVTKVDNLYDRTYPVKMRIPDHPVDALLMTLYMRPEGFQGMNQQTVENLVLELKSSTTLKESLAYVKNQEKTKKKKKRVKKKT